jgi:hypothetical protein
VPDEFRLMALSRFGEGVQRIVAASPSLRLLPPQQAAGQSCVDDEELAQTTIFPFVIERGNRVFSPDDCRNIYRALAQPLPENGSAGAQGRDPEIAARSCLIGQPVVLGAAEPRPVAALRICASARLVTETWSSDAATARGNLTRELGQVSAIAAKIEWLLGDTDSRDLSTVGGTA